MNCELDTALWQAWLKVKDNVLGNDTELRRRLDRRAKSFERIPRPLCLAIKASDHRLASLAPRHALAPGHEAEHDLPLDTATIRDLCRPVELYWGQHFRKLAAQLGSPRQVPRKLEKRGILRARRIPNLAGQHGLPVPLVDSPVPAMAPRHARWEDFGHPTLLDPGHSTHTAPHNLLLPYWQLLPFALPDSFQQTLRRKPIFRVQRGRSRFMHWTWVCPDCNRQVNTIYLPIGAPDFAALHDIQLPTDSTSEPYLCFACKRCHAISDLASTPRSISKSWSLLVTHMSGGLLFGHEVARPASFSAIRHNKPISAPRPSPRRDQLEAYLAHTDLPLKDIARRMHWTLGAVQKELHLICKKRRLKRGRPALKRWWAKHRRAKQAA